MYTSTSLPQLRLILASTHTTKVLSSTLSISPHCSPIPLCRNKKKPLAGLAFACSRLFFLFALIPPKRLVQVRFGTSVDLTFDNLSVFPRPRPLFVVILVLPQLFEKRIFLPILLFLFVLPPATLSSSFTAIWKLPTRFSEILRRLARN